MKDHTLELKLNIFEVKDVADEGNFSGFAAVYNNVDEGKDRIIPGAFTKTLKESGARIPLLWSHEAQTPIGVAKLSDAARGLFVEGTLNLNKSAGRDAYADLKFFQGHGIPFGMSIGYSTVKSNVDGEGVRNLTEIKLYETSLTLFPMNTAAMVESVKANHGSTKRLEWQIAEIRRLLRANSN